MQQRQQTEHAGRAVHPAAQYHVSGRARAQPPLRLDETRFGASRVPKSGGMLIAPYDICKLPAFYLKCSAGKCCTAPAGWA
jgi:hypothetical protein